MSLAFKWELPGGKLEANEEPSDCLQRETMEELGLEVRIMEGLDPIERTYREKEYLMQPFVCEVTGGELVVFEHEQAVWIPIEDLFTLDWAPVEIKILSAWAKKDFPGLKPYVPESRTAEYFKPKVIV